MKRILAIISCIVMLCLAAASALAAGGVAYIDGGSSDRVHLRKLPSQSAASLGLYFTGTEVAYADNLNSDWTAVTIGAQTGYMKTQYLTTQRVSSRQPAAKANVPGSWVNIRTAPSLQASAVGRLYHGQEMTVLGETSNNWYAVQTGNLSGYIKTEYTVLNEVPAAHSYKILTYNAVKDISLQYPYFTDAGMDALNTLVMAKVADMTRNDYAPDALTIDYQCAVTLNTAKAVSIIFWGYSNVEGSMHPYTDLISLNVSLSDMRELRLSDLYALNADFENVFFSKSFFPSAPVTSYDASLFAEMLTLQKPEQGYASDIGNAAFFLKPDGIVLSLPSIHATGSDHFEAQLRYFDIERFYRLSQPLWTE